MRERPTKQRGEGVTNETKSDERNTFYTSHQRNTFYTRRQRSVERKK